MNEEHGVVLTEDEIMALDPTLRSEMLDKNMLNNYSQEQQKVITELLAKKVAENSSFSSDLSDSAVLYERVRTNRKFRQKLIENPIEAALYQEGFRLSRLQSLYNNLLDRKKHDAFDLIDAAINNNSLEEYLGESMLRTQTIQQYIDEKNPSDEVKQILEKHIDNVKNTEDRLNSILNDIKNDESLSKEDKQLLSDAVTFLRLYNIDPAKTDEMYVALTTALADNPHMTAFESFVNAKNKERLLEDKIKLRPDGIADSDWSREADEKIRSIYSTLVEKAKRISKAQETKDKVEQPRTTENEDSGKSSAPETIEPTPEPKPEQVEEEKPEDNHEEKKPSDRYKSRVSQTLMTTIGKHKKFTEAMDWLKEHPDNSVAMMISSKARGDIGSFTQLVGMRGLFAKPSGGQVEIPVLSSFSEGISIS
jgi:hypothetical protein